MRQFLKFLIALLIAVIIVVAIHTFAFTVYTAPVAIGKSVRTGQKVVVNKLCRHMDLMRGDFLAFTVRGEAPTFTIIDPPQELGMVVAVPGDTIAVKGQRYRIPFKCCDRCQCRDCCLYLVDTGNGRRLVHKHQIVGKVLSLEL